jgi:hypothetical protein
MTGKTQMAFNIRSKRPLYFALHYNQPVNKFFRPASFILKNLLESDFGDAQNILISMLKNKAISYRNDQNTNLKETTEIITLDFLDAYLRHHKFKSLGYLVSFVKECENNYTENTNDEWMKFYAENQESFESLKHEPISLSELKAQQDVYMPLLEKYFFFIDEFAAESGIVMFRNMCRFLRIPCVLASTNSKIVNLIGASTNTGSGTCPPSVFCAVFPKLSTLSHEEIEHFFNEETNCDRFLELARNVSENEERRMSLLLQFFKDQAKKSRPGVSLYLFKALKEISESFPESESLKVDALFQEFIEILFRSINYRKKYAFSSLDGMQANVDLLGGKEFNSKYVPSEKSKNNGSSLIDSHFFYLKNPRADSKAEEPCLLFRNSIPFPTLLSKLNPENMFEVQGFFDENEELLKLVCLLGDMRSSSYKIIYPLKGRFHSAADTGKELEIITYATFLSSSHFNDENSVLLEGVGIKIS